MAEENNNGNNTENKTENSPEKANGKHEKQKLTPDKIRREIISWCLTIVFAVLFALFITKVVIVNAYVPSGSMLETIQAPSRIVAFRLAYTFSEPKRYDIVVFKYPDDEKEYFVKRIIGLPGETVEIKAGKVYINGSSEPLRDDFVAHPSYDDYGPITVPDGEYFMLGDDRSDSWDSRDWTNKFVASGKILGKVIFSYYPSVKLIK